MPSGAWLRTVFPAECDLGLQAARHNRTRWRERRRLHHRRSDERRRPDRAASSSGLVAVAALHHGRLRAAHNCRVSGAVATLDCATYLETGEVAPVNGGDYAEWTARGCRATQREPWCARPSTRHNRPRGMRGEACCLDSEWPRVLRVRGCSSDRRDGILIGRVRDDPGRVRREFQSPDGTSVPPTTVPVRLTSPKRLVMPVDLGVAPIGVGESIRAQHRACRLGRRRRPDESAADAATLMLTGRVIVPGESSASVRSCCL
jgi:hypothetical protein